MADVRALIRDPRFRMLTPEQQKAAASQVDERIGQLNDEQFRTFVSSIAPAGTTAGTGKTGDRLKGEPKPGAFFKPMVAGEKQIEQGYGKLGTGVDPTIGGLSDMFRGAGMMAYPYLAGIAAGYGLPGIIGAASTVPIGAGVEWGARAAHVPEGTSQALGDLAGIGGGILANKAIGAFGRSVAPYAAKIPMLPAKWKAGLKTISYLTPEAAPPPGEYLKHTEGRPGDWAYGMGVGPKAGTLPEWLSNLRNFRFDDMERKLRGQSAPPPAPSFQPESPLAAKRVGGFGSTGLGREPMGPPKTTYSPETLDVVPDPTAPRTVPPEAPSEPPVPTKKVGGFGATSLGRKPMGPPETTYSPETAEPGIREFKPTTIPEPPLPEDPVRGAEREAAEPQPEDAPPKFGTPEYADWFTKTWPDLQLPKGASGLPEPPTRLTPGEQLDVVNKVLQEKGLGAAVPDVTTRAATQQGAPLATEPVTPPAAAPEGAAPPVAAEPSAEITPAAADQARKTGTIPGTETPVDLDYVRRVAEQNEDTLYKTLNSWLHEAWKDAYGVKDAHRLLSDYLKGKYGLESMSGIKPDDALHEYHTLKDIAIKKHAGNAMENPPAGTATTAPPATEPEVTTNAMENPPIGVSHLEGETPFGIKEHRITISSGNQEVGSINLLHSEPGVLKVDDAGVAEAYRNQGYGKELYRRALGYAKSVGASYIESGMTPTEDAQRVWRSLGAEPFQDRGLTRYRLAVPQEAGNAMENPPEGTPETPPKLSANPLEPPVGTPSTILEAARDVYGKLGPERYSMDEFLEGTGANNRLDSLAKTNDPEFQSIYDAYSGVRDSLRAQYGETVPLYRSQPKGKFAKAREVLSFADTQAMAEKFIPKGQESNYRVIRTDVPVKDIVAVPVKGQYHEYIVRASNASANPMENPPAGTPQPRKAKGGQGRRVTIEKPASEPEPEPVTPPQAAKPVEQLKSNAERQAVEPSEQTSDPADVAANAIYGDDYQNLRPNSQMSLRRWASQHGGNYPTINDVKSGEFKRR